MPLDLACWRVAGVGGDMIRSHVLRDLANRFADVGSHADAFVASYGMAEAALALSFAPLDGGIHTDVVARGPLEHQNLAIPLRDDEARRDAPLSAVARSCPATKSSCATRTGTSCRRAMWAWLSSVVPAS
jgi:hypothetical protein